MNAKLLVLGTLAGALTLFAWETISNALIPWHAFTMRTFTDTNAVVQAIKANAPRTIGYGLLGLVLGAAINKGNGRVNTDEWGGVKAVSGSFIY